MPANYEAVRLLICDNSQMIRSNLKGALFSQGFRSIGDSGNFLKLHDAIVQDSVDLVIAGQEVENHDVGFLIQEMRHGRLGSNPFVVVILLLSNSDPDVVRHAIDSGADDLLLMPVAPAQLLARLDVLQRTRKPFIVTHDYIGPDRRSKVRPGVQAPTLNVPNPFRIRVEGGTDSTRLDRQIREAAVALSRMKIERHAVQVDWLVSHICAGIRDGTCDSQQVAAYADRLVRTADDIVARMRNTPAEVHYGIIADLKETAQKAMVQTNKLSPASLQKLHDLSKTVLRALGGLAQPVKTG